jgi:hypothetical protein
MRELGQEDSAASESSQVLKRWILGHCFPAGLWNSAAIDSQQLLILVVASAPIERMRGLSEEDSAGTNEMEMVYYIAFYYL